MITASGAAKSGVVHGATGMAGVSKTTALIALGHQKAVQTQFQDGVLFFQLGADASVKQITDCLADIMKYTGAVRSAAFVRNEIDLKKAADCAALWFRGRCNLFLIDDVWPTSDCTEGHLPKLRYILQGSPASRIVFSTRNVLIGSSASSHVDFDARDPLGPISTSIFKRYSAKGRRRDHEELERLSSVQGILGLCAGLPIALAVTGGFVAAQMSLGYNFESVCEKYFTGHEEKTNLGAPILERALTLSLEYLCAKLVTTPDISSEYSHVRYVRESLSTTRTTNYASVCAR